MKNKERIFHLIAILCSQENLNGSDFENRVHINKKIDILGSTLIHKYLKIHYGSTAKIRHSSRFGPLKDD